jgi:hypothetical protein
VLPRGCSAAGSLARGRLRLKGEAPICGRALAAGRYAGTITNCRESGPRGQVTITITITIVLAHTDLARVRFAHSPVEELAAAIRADQATG